MRLLLDNNLSQQLVRPLRDAGHDTEHDRDLGLQAVPDATVLEHAREHDQILDRFRTPRRRDPETPRPPSRTGAFA